MRRSFAMLVAGALLVALALPVRAQDPAVERGAALFAEQKCTMCHAARGQGNKRKPLDGVGSRIDTELARLWLVDPKAAALKAGKKGTPAMKSFKTLPAADLDALAAFIVSLK